MPRGYRYIVCALVGWLVLAGANPLPKSALDNQTKTEQSSAPQPNSSATATPNEPYANKNAATCYQANDYDAPELCAQWRAAIAAEKAADATRFANWISTAGAALSFISVILVLVALRQTRKAHALSEETATRQLRAYLSFFELDPGGAEKGEWKVQIGWKNCGSTPANNVIAFCNWRDFPEGLPADFDFPVEPLMPTEGGCAIGPDQQIFTACDRRLPLFVLPYIVSKKANIIVWSSVDYIDIYGASRRTEFAARLFAEALKDGTYGTRWDAIHCHNGMDGDCMKQPYADCPQLDPSKIRGAL